MAHTNDFQSELSSVRRLGWSDSDVHLAALHYGDVGTPEDVAEYLRTGDHLPPGKRQFITAAIWDAELDANASSAAAAPVRQPRRWPLVISVAALVLLALVAAVFLLMS